MFAVSCDTAVAEGGDWLLNRYGVKVPAAPGSNAGSTDYANDYTYK